MPVPSDPSTSATVIAAKVIWKHTKTYSGIATPCVKVAAVLSDVSVLGSLPRRMHIEGFAEVIKHAFILDPGLLDTLEANARSLASGTADPELMAHVIGRSSHLKGLIVSSDPQERGIRAMLASFASNALQSSASAIGAQIASTSSMSMPQGWRS